jgi:hypothetical protein
MLCQRVREPTAQAGTDAIAVSHGLANLETKNKGATPVKVLRPIKLFRKVFPSFVVQSCCATAVKLLRLKTDP